MADKPNKRFLYHAHTTALAGTLRKPFSEHIETQAGSALSVTGGVSNSRVEKFRHRDMLSCDAAYTTAVGHGEDGVHTTLVTATVGGFEHSQHGDGGPRGDADRVRSQAGRNDGTVDPDGGQPHRQPEDRRAAGGLRVRRELLIDLGHVREGARGAAGKPAEHNHGHLMIGRVDRPRSSRRRPDSP